jgi:o-succinylbenzoate synthase
MPIRLFRYHLNLDSRNWPVREGLVLQWDDGWGEIAPLPGFSKESLEQAEAEIRRILPHLAHAKPTLPSVRWGVQCASQPFPHKPVHIPLCSLGELTNGCQTVKLKLGHLSVEEAVALVKRYLNKFRLRVDCNRKWSLDEALQFAKHFKPDDFAYLEEPVHSFTDLVAFSKTTDFPIAVDESVRDGNPWDKISSLKAVVVKPTVVGAIPQLAPEMLVLSSSYESGLGLLHIARQAQQLGLTLPMGLDTYRVIRNDILTSPICCADGHLTWTPNPTQPPVDLSKLNLIASAP